VESQVAATGLADAIEGIIINGIRPCSVLLLHQLFLSPLSSSHD